MKKRKKNKNKKYLLIIVVGVLSIIVIYLFLINNTFLDSLKEVTASIFNVKSSSNKIIESAEIKDLKNEIKELKKLNNIDEVLADKIVINASVIKRSTPYWHNMITINKGRKDNIKKGYGVMSDNGLIGEVIIVNNNTSEVKLITNQDNHYISGKFNYKDKDYYGIIKKYNIITNELYLENVIGDLNKEIINLDVITSGLSSNIPSGLLIGKIVDIKKDKYNLSNTIKIKMHADINDINFVRVVGKDD